MPRGSCLSPFSHPPSLIKCTQTRAYVCSLTCEHIPQGPLNISSLMYYIYYRPAQTFLPCNFHLILLYIIHLMFYSTCLLIIYFELKFEGRVEIYHQKFIFLHFSYGVLLDTWPLNKHTTIMANMFYKLWMQQ